MKRLRNLKQKIIFYVMSVSIMIAALIVIIMSISHVQSTNALQLENMQVASRLAAQNISSNLHLLTERMHNFSTTNIFQNNTAGDATKSAFLEAEKMQIEFVWLSVYDTEGQKQYGDDSAPVSISDASYFSYLVQTENIVIGEPYYANDQLQLCVAAPIKSGDTVTGYVVGSYKYDLLHDVLSMLVFGKTGCACIINENGTIIGDRNLQNIIDQKNLYEMYHASRNQKVFDKVLSHQTGSELLWLGYVKNYVGYAPIPGTNWSLFLNVPQREYMGSAKLSIILSILFAILAEFAAAAVIIPVSNKVAVSLASVTDRLQSLADGNLTDEVILSENGDETDILTRELAKMVASLKRYIQDIESCLGALSGGDYTIEIPDDFNGDFASIRDSLYQISVSLNRTMLQMNHSSLEINRNSNEVSDYAKQLHDGSLNQSDLLDRLDESMAAITASIERNKENVHQIELCSTNASEKTTLGDSYMQSMLTTMNEIHSAVDEISEISHLIESISSQTNLLSLNASIEAARAGEAGRGFAVVAEEIGQLSTQTTEALQQTGAIISRAADIIERGLTTANQTAEAFREIQTVTEEYHAISEQLSQASVEQANAVESVNSQLSSLQDIADSNRALAEETDKMASGSLTQSEHLKDYVSQVKIRESL